MNQITTPVQLKAAYPYQFDKPIDASAFSFARGWMPIIVRACEEIDVLVRADEHRHGFHWVQIKEKFGTLRMYWSAGEPRGVVDQSGGNESSGMVTAQIAAITRAAEAQSAQTCMVCGSAGLLRRGAWAVTLCDKHARQHEQGKRLEIAFRSEKFGFEWDSAAIPVVPLRSRRRAVFRFHRELDTFVWRLARLEGLQINFFEAQTLASGAPVTGLDAGQRAAWQRILSACRELERLTKTADEFRTVLAKRILDEAGCELSDESGNTLLGRVLEFRDFENVLERALVTFALISAGGLVQPQHAVRGGLLLAQAALISAGADPLMPTMETSGADLARAIENARQTGDATELMRLLARWHPDAGLVLFLDFDGVLHPAPIPGRPGESDLFSSLHLLEDVLRQAPAVDVVISSSWREQHSLEEIREFFAEDVRYRVVGMTPMPGVDIELAPLDLVDYPRHTQCAAWMARHRPYGMRWLAIDDDAEHFRPGCENLLLVDGRVGLTPENAADLLRRVRSAATRQDVDREATPQKFKSS